MLNKNQLNVFMIDKGVYFLIGMLLFNFFTDAVNSILRYLDDSLSFLYISEYFRMSFYSRGLIWAALLLFFGFVNVTKLYFWGLIIFSLVLMYFGFEVSNTSYMMPWFIRFVKLTLPFLLWWFISTYKIHQFSILANTYLLIISIQLIAVFIPFIFGLDFLLSYYPPRFGYSGFIIAQNEATFFYLIAGIFLLKLWEIKHKRQYIIGFFAVVAGSVLLGAKAGFLVSIGLIGFFLYRNVQRLGKSIIFILVGVIGSGIAVFYLSGMYDFYYSLMEIDGFGFWSMITSLRSDLFLERVPKVLDDWSFSNYLFGGVNPVRSFVEMDIIDLFLFGGIIGSALYYWGLFRTLFAFKKGNNVGWFLVGMYFLVGGMAGHFFASGVNAFYLVLVCSFLQRGERQSQAHTL